MDILLLCIKIFLVRIIDVSLGTIRTVFTVKDKIVVASLIGFVEVLIWFIVVKDALNSNANNLIVSVFYAMGFACGTYVGGIIAKRFMNRGSISVQVIIDSNKNYLVELLHKKGYAVSVLKVSGYHDTNKLLLFSEINSCNFDVFKDIVTKEDESAFIVVSDTKAVYNGYFLGNSK